MIHWAQLETGCVSNQNHGPWLLAVFTVSSLTTQTAQVSSGSHTPQHSVHTHWLELDNYLIQYLIRCKVVVLLVSINREIRCWKFLSASYSNELSHSTRLSHSSDVPSYSSKRIDRIVTMWRNHCVVSANAQTDKRWNHKAILGPVFCTLCAAAANKNFPMYS